MPILGMETKPATGRITKQREAGMEQREPDDITPDEDQGDPEVRNDSTGDWGLVHHSWRPRLTSPGTAASRGCAQ